jgi:hypothetical protein
MYMQNKGDFPIALIKMALIKMVAFTVGTQRACLNRSNRIIQTTVVIGDALATLPAKNLGAL